MGLAVAAAFQYTVLVLAIEFVLLGPPVGCVDMVMRDSACSNTSTSARNAVSTHVRATVAAHSPSPLGQQFSAGNVSFS